MNAAELIGTTEGRRALSIASPQFFDTYYCEMRRAPHRDRWLELFESSSREARETGVKSKLLVLAPRDHGKTEAAISFVTRALCLDRNIRILWISESQNQAEKRMRRVVKLLQSSKIQEDWTTAPQEGAGPFGDSTGWRSNMIYLLRSKNSVDASLECIGAGGAVTGGHFDLILADDIQDDKNTYTQGVRRKTREWWAGTVGPMLSRGGASITIGTRKHDDDLFGHMLEDPTVRVIQDQAIVAWPSSYSYTRAQDDLGREIVTGVEYEGGRALWEAERPLDYLLLEKRAIGTRLFEREFQNNVTDESSAAFKMAWLNKALERGAAYRLGEVPPQVIDIVQGWDFSLVTDPRKAESRDTDFTVGITWGRDDEGNRYLIDIFRKRGMSPTELRARVTAEYEKYGSKIRVVAVERNAFGELHYLGLQRGTDLPLKGHITHARNKADPWEGVPALSVLAENEKMVFPSSRDSDRERLEPLIDELYSLGKARHDDTVMSLWIAETWLRKSAFRYTLDFGGREYTGSSEERLFGNVGDDLTESEYIRETERQDLDTIWGDLLHDKLH